MIASPTAIRPDAGASATASGVRSPIAIASPAKPLKSASVIAQSATGTCHGPTIGSRHDRPPTVRSPIVTRKRLLATVGWRRTSKATVLQLDVGEVERRQRERTAAHVAVHLRRLAEEDVHRHVDRRGAIVSRATLRRA